MKKFCLYLFLGLIGNASAQNHLKLNFMFKNNGVNIALNQPMTNLAGVSYKASDVAFYFSNLKITHDGGQILDFGEGSFYVNARATTIDLGMKNIDIVESLSFDVGVPQNINHTDITAYPEDHPLYFQSPPMHWGWSAGYTFFLIDGMADSDNNGIPDVGMEIHCLGDENLKHVVVNNKATIYPDGTREIFQEVNIDQWLRNVDLVTSGIQHGNTGINAEVMQNVLDFPVFSAPQNAGITSMDKNIGEASFSNLASGLQVSWKDMLHLEKLELYASDGKFIADLRTKKIEGIHLFSDLEHGAYILRFVSNNGQTLRQLTVVQP